jgi:hypothetical protein
MMEVGFFQRLYMSTSKWGSQEAMGIQSHTAEDTNRPPTQILSGWQET